MTRAFACHKIITLKEIHDVWQPAGPPLQACRRLRDREVKDHPERSIANGTQNHFRTDRSRIIDSFEPGTGATSHHDRSMPQLPGYDGTRHQ